MVSTVVLTGVLVVTFGARLWCAISDTRQTEKQRAHELEVQLEFANLVCERRSDKLSLAPTDTPLP